MGPLCGAIQTRRSMCNDQSTGQPTAARDAKPQAERALHPHPRPEAFLDQLPCDSRFQVSRHPRSASTLAAVLDLLRGLNRRWLRESH